MDVLLNRVQSIITSQDQQFSTLQELRASVEELRASDDVLRASVERLTLEHPKTRSELMARIDRLQETVELVRDDLTVNWATANTAINRARNSREDVDDLQKQISAMERRYQTLTSLMDGLRSRRLRSQTTCNVGEMSQRAHHRAVP
jgi:chromosome segregation ATPase